jgi:hypothetical protein
MLQTSTQMNTCRHKSRRQKNSAWDSWGSAKKESSSNTVSVSDCLLVCFSTVLVHHKIVILLLFYICSTSFKKTEKRNEQRTTTSRRSVMELRHGTHRRRGETDVCGCRRESLVSTPRVCVCTCAAVRVFVRLIPCTRASLSSVRACRRICRPVSRQHGCSGYAIALPAVCRTDQWVQHCW